MKAEYRKKRYDIGASPREFKEGDVVFRLCTPGST